MPRSYVNNAYNRSVGRVGMPVGSAVISRGSSGGGGGSSCSSGGSSSYSSGGRGASYGGDGGGSYSSTNTYVDNSYNRVQGRVGLPHGSAVISKSASASSSSDTSGATTKTYVDNAYNREHGRVGLPHGTAVISKSGSSSSTDGAKVDASQKVYKDNILNRKLGRVGKDIGTCVVSKKGGPASIHKEVYADNAENRRLKRVGLPRGSKPKGKASKTTFRVRKILDEISDDAGSSPCSSQDDQFSDSEYEQAISQYNRRLEELAWQQQRASNRLATASPILEKYRGQEIDFDEIQLGKKIGQGGFGDVHFATWQDTVVAVKKLRVQSVSEKRLQTFAKEVMAFCDLDHPNIVRFIGACLRTPSLAIVMEYMQTSLFIALHMGEHEEMTEGQELAIITQTANGLLYLHQKGIAHCDLKSQNILLSQKEGEGCIAKITDFGLSMIKADAESSMSSVEQVRNVGTPRYSSPEVLLGEMLSAKEMMLTDIYSFALIMFEVIYVEEPYYDLNIAQLQKQVGERGHRPDIPADPVVSKSIGKLMKECWNATPKGRPDMEEVCRVLGEQVELYIEAEA